MPIVEKFRPFYTYEKYYQWKGRWELIERMPYGMSPLPVPEHQNVCGNLSAPESCYIARFSPLLFDAAQ